MVLTKAKILALLLRLPAWHGDVETEEQRIDRYGVIATAIVEAAEERPFMGSSDNMAILLAEQAYSETRLARHVHAGECRVEIGECDSGKAGTPWQIQWDEAWYPKEKWDQLIGMEQEPTTLAAKRAAEILAMGANYCRAKYNWDPAYRGRELGWAISIYGKGSCTGGKTAARERLFWRLKRLAVQEAG